MSLKTERINAQILREVSLKQQMIYLFPKFMLLF